MVFSVSVLPYALGAPNFISMASSFMHTADQIKQVTSWHVKQLNYLFFFTCQLDVDELGLVLTRQGVFITSSFRWSLTIKYYTIQSCSSSSMF